MMTDDEIERLALAAGCYPPGASRNYWAITDQMLRRFAELAQEIERNNADNLRQQVADQMVEIERLRDELMLCCELKRTYQEHAAAERERCAAAVRAQMRDDGQQDNAPLINALATIRKA